MFERIADLLIIAVYSRKARLTPDATIGERVKGEEMKKWVQEVMEERRLFWAGTMEVEQAAEDERPAGAAVPE